MEKGFHKKKAVDVYSIPRKNQSQQNQNYSSLKKNQNPLKITVLQRTFKQLFCFVFEEGVLRISVQILAKT